MSLNAPRRLLPILALLALLASPGWAETLTEGEFKDARREARRLMDEPGTLKGKQIVIRRLGEDDSVRACDVLVDWMRDSLRLQRGPLAEELEETKERFDRTVEVLEKAYDRVPPVEKNAEGQNVVRWRDADHKNAYESTKRPYDMALRRYEAEDTVRFTISEALESVRDEAAVRWLMDDGLQTLSRARPPELAVTAVVRCLAHQPRELAEETLLEFAADDEIPRARIIALGWIGERQIETGFDVLVEALEAREVAVQRAAVTALMDLSDPHAVKPLIDALKRAEGVLAVEIEDALHHFVGLSMEGSHAAWRRWWQNEGEAWVASNERSRHGPRERRRKDDGYGFYGIETESKRIVFVLDRSGSMTTEADPESKKTRPEEEGEPPVVTGPGAGGGRRRDPEPPPVVAGDTKIEVAKNQLEWSINQLPKDVLFGVVFYSTDVEVWNEPPEMVPASRSNKKKAIEWFEPIEANGSTTLFDALMKALEYADTLEERSSDRNKGADTIFLLTDGSPTDKHDGKRILTHEEIEAAMARFHEVNEVYRCTVHTIGIGRAHNAGLLRRIARETGGTYRRAGQ